MYCMGCDRCETGRGRVREISYWAGKKAQRGNLVTVFQILILPRYQDTKIPEKQSSKRGATQQPQPQQSQQHRHR